MTELVKNKICAQCGADVRPDSLFCYSCGSSVAPETIVALKDKNDFDSQNNKLNMPGNGTGKTTKLKEPSIEKPAGKPFSAPVSETSAANNAELKSAATMRRKSKIYQPKRTEIVWEERGGSANVWFVLSAIILTLAAAGIFYLAVYLK